MISQWMRQRDMQPKVSNLRAYGTLINPAGYDDSKLYPDLFLYENNPTAWENVYRHPEYSPTPPNEFVRPECWDIYNYPLFSETFAEHFVNESEYYGGWSGGSTNDKRLKGGYEVGRWGSAWDLALENLRSAGVGSRKSKAYVNVGADRWISPPPPLSL